MESKFNVFDANGRKVEVSTSTMDINGLTTETSIADGDYVPLYDVSATANRKMTKANFVSGLVNSYSAVSAYKTSDQTGLSSGAWNKITFDTERFDIGGTFASSTWTVPRTGYARIRLNVSYYFSSTCNYQFALYQNGSRITTAIRFGLAVFFSANVYDCGSFEWLISVTSGDTIEVYENHGSGTGSIAGNQAGSGNTEIMCEMVS